MLVSAVQSGDVAKVRELLSGSAPLDQALLDEALMEAVTWSLRGTSVEVARLLLDRGANPNARRRGKGPTVFLNAIDFRNHAMVELLIERGADVLARDQANEDLIHHYLRPHNAQADDDWMVLRLLAAGVPLASTHLAAACRLSNVAIVKALLKAGADLDAHPLIRAASEGARRSEVLEVLVDAGLDVNAREGHLTFLAAVCAAGNVSAARKLLDRGADPNAERALISAMESGNQALIDLLLERGAKPLRAALPVEVTAELDAAEEAARARPEEPYVRLAWAEVLAKYGFRAAAACETEWLVGKGIELPEALRSKLVFDTLDGSRWSFAPFEPHEGVTPRIADERFPGATVTDGKRSLPLLVTMGPPCTRCDERGEELCMRCNGAGFVIEGMGDNLPCGERQLCVDCLGTKFKIVCARESRHSCSYPFELRYETRQAIHHTMIRCQKCGLAALIHANNPYEREWACAVCSRFICICPVTGPRYRYP